MNEIEKFEQELEKLYAELETGNFDAEEKVLELEEQLKLRVDYAHSTDEKRIKTLLQKIEEMKKEFDFYDQEGELDMMFPDRHDDDFDEDSMNIFDND